MSVFEEMQEAGCFPYADPEALEDEGIDPLIRPAVEAINRSGWVWTGESCQGHPDAEHRFLWAGNTDPFLRLLCRTPNEGRMMSCLLQAAVAPGYKNPVTTLVSPDDLMAEDERATYSAPLRLTANHRDKGWTEVLVYVEASTVWARNMGIRFFERFAGLLTPDPSPESDDGE